MEIFRISKQADTKAVTQFLKELFPCLSFFYLDELWEHPPGFDVNNPQYLTFNYKVNHKLLKFPVELRLFRSPESLSEERALYIARHFSDAFQMPVLVPVTDPTPDKDPYLNVLFENNTATLVADYEYDWTDGSCENIQVVKEYAVPDMRFDCYGNFSVSL